MLRAIVLFIVLFTSHVSCAAPQKTIGIFTCDCGVKPWDLDSIAAGITGSEEAIIYMSQELVKLDYAVVVFANPPLNSRHSLPGANPRFVPLNSEQDTKFDIAISWRMPGEAKNLKLRADQVYLWPHDTIHWRLNLEQINGFTDTLWISKWQRKQWMSVNPAFVKFNTFFGNGIVPDQFSPVQERPNPYACIYGSNYARGLEILLDIWPEIKNKFPKSTLDIYYGWQHWGLLSPEKEMKMRLQIASLASLGVVEHGLVGHEELNRAYEKASLWTYPCIAQETFCITALRAQMAGAVPVVIDGSALTETVRHGFKCQNAEEYLSTLIRAMETIEDTTVEERRKMREFVLKEYTWKAIASKWKELFDKNSVQEAIPDTKI